MMSIASPTLETCATMEKMFVILVGPKGSGKSHIGRILERRAGVFFFHVEPLWMAYYAECRAAGRDSDVREGIERVQPQIAEALLTHEHVCVETTGASPEILEGLLSLSPPAQRMVVRLSVPLALCLARIESRDPKHQIPVEDDVVIAMYGRSVAAEIRADVTLENTGLSDDEIVATFEGRLRAEK